MRRPIFVEAEQAQATMLIPAVQGDMRVLPGEWIVRHPNKTVEIMSNADFQREFMVANEIMAEHDPDKNVNVIRVVTAASEPVFHAPDENPPALGVSAVEAPVVVSNKVVQEETPAIMKNEPAATEKKTEENASTEPQPESKPDDSVSSGTKKPRRSSK
jgi:hypothetical protein